MLDVNSPSRQRVAIVYHFFAHYRGPVMRELLENGRHEYLLVGDTQDPCHSGVKVWDIPDPSRFIYTPTYTQHNGVMIQKGLSKLVTRKDIDTVIFLGNAKYLTTWTAAALAHRAGKRVLFWTQGWRQNESGVQDWVRRRFYRLADGLLLYSNYAKQIGIQKGFLPENLYVIYNSLDYKAQQHLRTTITPQTIAATRQALFPIPNRPVLAFIGRLVPRKRLDLLFEAAHQLRLLGKEINLLIIGDGPVRPALEKLAATKELAVHFHGECYDEAEVCRLISAANATVAPDAIGLTAIHSLVYGTPVVTSDNQNTHGPEFEAITPGINGSLYKYGDSNALVEAISMWTHTDVPSDLIRAQCFKVVDEFYNPEYQRIQIDQAVSAKSRAREMIG